MNFGSGSVEPTRPQHEVFANDDTIAKQLSSAAVAMANNNSSAAAEAWMAAAMHASQMQASVSMGSRNVDQPSDSLSLAGLSNWWRQSAGA